VGLPFECRRIRRDLQAGISLRAANNAVVWVLFLSVLVFSCNLHLRGQTFTAQKEDFHQSSWGAEDGLGAVFDIQQSHDGYLWLTTSRGVLRFDGVKFETMEEVSNGAIRNDEAYTAMAGRGDYVWLTTRASGLLLWKDRKVTAFPFDRRCVTSSLTNGMVEDLDGSLWVRALSGLYHLNGSSCENIGREQGYPGGLPAAIFVDTNDTVWVKAPSGELVSRSRGESKFRLRQYVSGPSPNPAFLGEGPEGGIWISDDNGIRPVDLRASAIEFPPTSPIARLASSPFGDFAFSPDHSLWVVTPDGLSHVSQMQWQRKVITDTTSGYRFTQGDGLSSNVVWRILVSREGDIWIASNSGLDQLRRTVLKSIVLPPAKQFQYAIAAGDEGSVWIGSMGLPLTHVKADGTIESFPKIHDVTCIRRDRHGTVWVGANRLFRVREAPRPTILEMHYPQEDSARVVAIAVDRNDELWVTVRPGPTYHKVNGDWRDESDAVGKKPGTVGDMMTDDAGNIWFAFATYLVRWDGKSYQKYFYSTGPLDISVVTMAIGDDHVWLAGRGGTIMFTGGHFYPMTYDDRDMPGRVSGIVETRTGDLWMNGASGINHVSADDVKRYLRNPQSLLHAKRFDAQDGLPGFSAERFPVPSMVESGDHRLWFVTTKGIASLDPMSVEQRRNLLPPPVSVKSILANGVRFAAARELRLPKRTENVEIDYTALSLTIPKRVFFRYKLDGLDGDWRPAVSRRQAFYANLHPGRYRFHVIACNNDGVWNETGAVFDFVIPPTFVQSSSFKAICVAAFAAFLLLAYRFRMIQVTRQLRGRMSARAAEREAIARDLHDTFFQSIQGLLLRFHTATSKLQPEHPAREMFEEVLKESDDVMAEGRDLLVDLHATTSKPSDLPTALADYGKQMREGCSGDFKVAVNGSIRPLHPIIFEELFRIGKEAIGNAFRHSTARSIEAELNYEPNELRMRIRDDGTGIDPNVLKEGHRDGHLGLPSMRERARNIGAQLDLWSRTGVGTEIELRIAARLAYASGSDEVSLKEQDML
jgi:signal transduction histidine kinase/ligand-binding sensor domain-containing protein